MQMKKTCNFYFSFQFAAVALTKFNNCNTQNKQLQVNNSIFDAKHSSEKLKNRKISCWQANLKFNSWQFSCLSPNQKFFVKIFISNYLGYSLIQLLSQTVTFKESFSQLSMQLWRRNWSYSSI